MTLGVLWVRIPLDAEGGSSALICTFRCELDATVRSRERKAKCSRRNIWKVLVDDVKTSSELVGEDVYSFFAPEKELYPFSLRVSNYESSNRV